ncbi:DUF1360 domain-containing protein [Streptomyces pratensis]|uniref:DUF1360 domain-containing protein n=1 Tax=Streptomyces pratensis TaxID=1169025 RepID=UPI0036380B33
MIQLTELALLDLAGCRATQPVVHGTILDPARDRVHQWHEARLDSVAREVVITLISCVYCMGWWISGALLAVHLLVTSQFHATPLLVHGLEWFASPARLCS